MKSAQLEKSTLEQKLVLCRYIRGTSSRNNNNSSDRSKGRVVMGEEWFQMTRNFINFVYSNNLKAFNEYYYTPIYFINSKIIYKF